MTTHNDRVIREYLTEIARKGGKARAKKYDKKTLSKWAKKGGRPKGSGGKEK
jgi:general stress protein YciG